MKPYQEHNSQNRNASNSGKTLTTHRWYFAIYANMARHNLYKSLKVVSEYYSGLTGKNVSVIEDKIKEAPLFSHLLGKFKPKISITGKETDNKYTASPKNDKVKITDRLENIEESKEVLEKTWNELTFHFPFLETIKKVREQYHRDRKKQEGDSTHEAEGNRTEEILYSIATLQQMAKTLHNLRNHCSHYSENTNLNMAQEKNYLPEIYKQAVFDLEAIENYDAADIKHLYEPSHHQYKFYGISENSPAENDMRFFLCLFLTNSEGHKFLKQIKGFRGASFPNYAATPKCYTWYSIRLPEPVFNPYQNKTTLLMDALNYLQRVPEELYEVLKPSDKAKFEKDPVLEYDEEEQNTPTKHDKVKMIRYVNRFLPFILNWLGNRWASQPKDGYVYAFELRLCKVQDIVEPEKAEGKEIYVKEERLVRTFGLPDFWFGQKEIKFKDKSWKTSPSFITTDKRMNIIGVKKIRKERLQDSNFHSLNEKHLFPDFYLSLNELKNIAVAELEKEGSAIATIEKINGIQNGIFKLVEEAESVEQLQKVLSKAFKEYDAQYGEGFVKKIIPKKILSIISPENQWLQNPLFPERYTIKNKVLKKIENQLLDSLSRKQRINKYLDDMEEYGDGSLPKVLRPGEIAGWLTSDIQHYLPLQYKLNSGQFKELQRRIALYNTESSNGVEVLGYLKRTQKVKVGSGNKTTTYHQFLAEVIKDGKIPEDHLDFYGKYLQAKERWLEKMKKKLDDQCKTEDDFKRNFGNEIQYFTSGEKEEKQSGEENSIIQRNWFKTVDLNWLKTYIRNLKNQRTETPTGKIDYSGAPGYFPTGVFLDSLPDRDAVKGKYTAPQPMYDFTKQYLLLKAGKDKTKGNRPPVYLNIDNTADSLKSIFDYDTNFAIYKRKVSKRPDRDVIVRRKQKEIQDNEQVIRYHKACDGIMWEIARTELSGVLGLQKNSLEYNDANLFEKEVEMEILEGLTTKVKIKNYGRYRKYRNDRRLENTKDSSRLSDYLSKPSVSPEDVQKEFNEYDKQRAKFLELCFMLEKNILDHKDDWAINHDDQLEYDKVKEQGKQPQKKNYFSFDYLLHKAENANKITSQQNALLRWSRNAALHNQLPNLDRLEAAGLDKAAFINDRYFLQATSTLEKIILSSR